jgi:hypothetical protein
LVRKFEYQVRELVEGGRVDDGNKKNIKMRRTKDHEEEKRRSKNKVTQILVLSLYQ